MNTYAPTYDATQPNVPGDVLTLIIVGAFAVLVIAGTTASRWNSRRNRRHPDEERAILAAKDWAKKQAPR